MKAASKVNTSVTYTNKASYLVDGDTAKVVSQATKGKVAYTGQRGSMEASAPLILSREVKEDALGGGGDSLLDYYAISARKPAPATKGNSLFGENRRVRRFYQRYFAGVGVGGQLRILTLTTSDEAVASGYDIHRHFRALVLRLRRRYGAFEYIGVKEVKGGREHLHIVFRGKYMEQALISAIWQAIHQSKVVDIRAVYKARGGVRYLAKYLAKDAINRYWASYNWVFQGWVGWSKRFNRWVGHYPSKTVLKTLARLDVGKRLAAMWVLCPVAMILT